MTTLETVAVEEVVLSRKCLNLIISTDSSNGAAAGSVRCSIVLLEHRRRIAALEGSEMR